MTDSNTNAGSTTQSFREAGDLRGLVQECFPASTPIAVSSTETRPISDIRVGDTVLAFDPAADLGRGALVPRKVVRLYRNSTNEWGKLTWSEGGEAKELVATPGHHVLDRFGNLSQISWRSQGCKTRNVNQNLIVSGTFFHNANTERCGL